MRTGRGDAVAVAAWDAFDEPVQAESPEIVRPGAGRIRVGVAGLELRDVLAELAMAKPRGCQRKEAEGVHERVHATIAEAEAGGAAIVDADGGRDGVEAVFADQAIVAQRFDV